MLKNRIVLLGTARNDFILAAHTALSGSNNDVVVLVKDGRKKDFIKKNIPCQTFSGQVLWWNLRLLYRIRKSGATKIAIVVGDQQKHENVVMAFRLWKILGALPGSEICFSYSFDPAFLEYFSLRESRAWAFFLFVGLLLSGFVFVWFLFGYLSILICLGAIASMELLLRLVKSPPGRPDAEPEVLDSFSIFKRMRLPFITPDKTIGWRNCPINCTAEYINKSLSVNYTWHINIDHSGARQTSSDPEKYCGNTLVFLCGSSQTFGSGISDEQTFAWVLQQKAVDLDIKNHAVQGYSTYQICVELAIRILHTKPKIVVLEISDKQIESGNTPWINLHKPDTDILDNLPAFIGHTPFTGKDNKKPMLELFKTPLLARKFLANINPFWEPEVINNENKAYRLLAWIKQLCDKNDVKLIAGYLDQQSSAYAGVMDRLDIVRFSVPEIDRFCSINKKRELHKQIATNYLEAIKENSP